MTHWWRAYDEAVDDPKLQLLPPPLFKGWFNLLCLASANGGILPLADAIAFKLRITEAKVGALIEDLVQRGLIDEFEGKLRPHNWDGRQFKSDVTDPTNAERQRRYRERYGVTAKSVTVTPPRVQRTDTDTERKKESCRVADATPTPSRKRKTYSEEFEGFWSSYPRTPVMSKTEAWKAWEKLSPEDRVNSAEAVPRFVEWLRGKPDHPAVHACRFLSQRRFEGFTTGPPADADLALLEQHRKACMERTNGNAEPEIRGTPGVGEDGSDLAGELRSSDGVVWRDNQEMGR